MVFCSVLGCMVFVLSACSNKVEKQATEAAPPPEPPAAEAQPPAPPAPPAPEPVAGNITMLMHLKVVNKAMCDVMVQGNPEKSAEECVTEFNKLSELNPQNLSTMVSKAKSEECVAFLKGVSSEEVMMKSVEGPCAIEALQP